VDRAPRQALLNLVVSCDKRHGKAYFPASVLSISGGVNADALQVNSMHGRSCGDYTFPGCEAVNTGKSMLLPLKQDAPEILSD